MCLFTLLRHSVRMENAIKPLHSNVSLQFHVFLKTESSHTRARTFRNVNFHDFQENRKMHESVYIWGVPGADVLLVTPGYSRLLRVTPGYSGLLRATPGYSGDSG